MPASKVIEEAILNVNDQTSFIQKLLIDTLNWPVNEIAESIEDITYEWSANDLRADGLSRELVDGSILQLRPFPGNPWGIFILEFKNSEVFKTNRGMTGILRQVLNGLVASRRKAPHLTSFNRDNLLFICSHQYQYYRFVYFRPPKSKNIVPPLVYFGWGPGDSIRTVCEFNLKNLAWLEGEQNEDKWLELWGHAFDVERVTNQFYEEYLNIFESAQNRIKKSNELNKNDSFMFTQTLFNRLMFLRFTEKKGWLSFNERKEYLLALFEAKGCKGKSFYQGRLSPLFFKGLGVKGSQKDEAYGSVVFLNGGLFEESDMDKKVSDIPDDFFQELIGDKGLFYRYNFTVEESTPLDVQVAIDPEMLGKVFEELIGYRQETGAYYTPREIVSFMCQETLEGFLGGYKELITKNSLDEITIHEAKELIEKLEGIKVVDPACGSGAYLLGMMHELHSLSRLLNTHSEKVTPKDDYEIKLQIIQNNLYGVDIDPVAIQIARLRLWLSLLVDYEGEHPEPLPNLDFKVEVGDSLASPDPKDNANPDMFREEQITKYDALKAKFQKSISKEEKISILKEINELKDEIREYSHPGQNINGFDWRVEFAEVFIRQNSGFDIVIANPPYGNKAKVSDRVRNQYFPQSPGGNQSKDPYGIFIARGLQLIRLKGQFCFIVSDTWRTIKSFLPLRKRIANETTIKHVIDLPLWIFKAVVNTSILTLESCSPSKENKFIAADLKSLQVGDWHNLAENLFGISSQGPDIQGLTYARYSYYQSAISQHTYYPFFIGHPSIYSILTNKKMNSLVEVANIVAGLQTGDNEFYLRKAPGIRGGYKIIDSELVLSEEEISNFTDEEKQNGVDPDNYGGRYFFPYDKGGSSDTEVGWLPNYHVPTGYYMDWSRKAVRRLRTASIKDVKTRKGQTNKILEGDDSKRAAVIRNEPFYFKEGMTYSRTGNYAPTFRLSCGSIFDSKGDGLFPNESEHTSLLLGILNSLPVRYFLKIFICHSVQAEGDALEKLPISLSNVKISRQIEALVDQIILKQKTDLRYPFFLNEQKEIDDLVFQLYGFTGEDIREVKIWYCRRYSQLAKAQGVLGEVEQKYSDYLEKSERILSTSPKIWQTSPVLTFIAGGESSTIEFKETLEADNDTGAKHPGVLMGALKTINAFLNTNGGKLLIGVSDKGEIKGLKLDFMLCQKGKQDQDGFELKLRDLIKARLKPIPLNLIAITFEVLLEGIICIIDVSPSKDESYLNESGVYVRDGNRTIQLSGKELVDWVKNRNS
jgi:type I restriction-modification system DNA methylase subunit